MTTTPTELILVMPKLGLTMLEATLTRWLKNAGQAVRQNEILFEFESDKSLMEYECPTDGVLAQILVAAGNTVPCGTPVARLQPAGATAITPPPTITATPAAKRQARLHGIELAQLTGRGPQGRIQLADVVAAATAPTAPVARVTPVAERLADELGVDWTKLDGSGSGGRVHKADVLQAAPPPPQPAARTQPLTGIRGAIASRMSDSAFSAPHVTLFAEADATALVDARRQLNAETPADAKISYNTLLAAIVARLLPDHPALNACITGNSIHFYADINIALAVDTERGLLAPVLKNANRLDLLALQRAGNALIERAVAGQSLPDDLTGGTFTITNLGMYQIDGFTPIINQPQSAILGVGQIAAKAVVSATGEIVARHMLTLSLSFDHRIVDGAPAARFLQRIKQLIERPFALLLSR